MLKTKDIVSKSILKYLQTLTRLYLRRYDIEISGLTGSAGKTTLTIAIHSVLSKKYNAGMTYSHGRGLNSESGIPFAILDVPIKGYSTFEWIKYIFLATKNFLFKKSKYEKFIVEMGVDKPGDMDFILSMTEDKTNLGLFLSIAKMHTKYFEEEAERRGIEPIEVLFEEKAKIIQALNKDGWAVLNYDEPLIRSLKEETEANTITFGLNKGADVRGEIVKIDSREFKGRVFYKDMDKEINISSYFVNKKVFRTVLAAIAVGLTYNIDLNRCVGALENMNFPPGRMSRIQGIKKMTIIDSTYNASRGAMSEALDNLALFRKRRKIAVLGDMRELGKDSKDEHEKLAKKAVKVADKIVTVGPQMAKYFVPEAKQLGYKDSNLKSFQNTWKALAFIKNRLIKEDDVLLIKGSQNTLFLEIIVENLMLKIEKSEDVLCRRGEYWDKKREELKLLL